MRSCDSFHISKILLFTKFIAIAELAPCPRNKAGERRAIMQAAIARNGDLAAKLIERPNSAIIAT
jgi:hypothetical protein